MSDRDCENCKHHTEKGCDSWDCNFEQRVTRKEAIKVFEDMKKGIYPYDPNVYLDIAINSLEIDERYELEYEQIEPCEDAISRKAVLDCQRFIYDETGEALEVILAENVLNLPPIAPQPKIGHWTRWYEQKENVGCIEYIPHCKCSECGKEYDPHSSQFIKFCCECGAKMSEEEE